MSTRQPIRVVVILLVLAVATPAIGWSQGTSASPVQSDAVFDMNASTDELLESAREMFISDRYDLAGMLYKSVLVRDPNNLAAIQELAIIYEASGRLEYARGLLTRALIIRPDDPEIIRRHAEVAQKLSTQLETEIDSLIGAGAYQPAIPKLSILLTTQPEKANLYYKKAQCHLQLGNPEMALLEIDRALNIARETRFDDLKMSASAAKHRRQVKTLTLEAQRALAEGSAEGNDEALQSIGRILELEPDNTWAKEQFLALTENLYSGLKRWKVPERLSKWWVFAERHLLRAWNGLTLLFEVFRSHINVLLAIALALLLLISPLTTTLVQGFSPRHPLSGRLGYFRLHELLTLMNTHGVNGVLILKTRATSGKIYFRKGEVYHCKSGRTDGRTAVQHLLKEPEGGSFVFRDGVTSREETVDTPLSLILLELPERTRAITSESIIKKQKQKSRMKELLSKGK